uniref:Cytoskeleton-associated protein 2 C-terminal domain-containing protein n=1 Tax=Leptobrachium leishanense TaxID=445787 RepID=A0A8C5LX09_9ANUR
TGSFFDSSQITDSRIKEPATSTLLKENQGKEGPSMTFTRTFLKTKALKEKQLKDEKLKAESSKEVSAKPAKPMLGVYRGKVIQSRINSFRSAPPCTTQKGQAEEDKLGSKAHVATTKPSSAPVRQVSKPMPTSGMELRRPFTSKARSNRQQQVSAQTRSPWSIQWQDGATKTRSLQQSKERPTNTCSEACRFFTATKQIYTTENWWKDNYPAHRDYIFVFSLSRARLAEWRASKGKVMKRPPRSAAMASTYKVIKEVAEVKNEPVMKSEPEPPRTIEKPRQLFWTTMAEEDEQEDVLAILENQIQSLPEAKKIPKYWVCLARLEQREGQLEKVFAVCEEAASAGVQVGVFSYVAQMIVQNCRRHGLELHRQHQSIILARLLRTLFVKSQLHNFHMYIQKLHMLHKWHKKKGEGSVYFILLHK